MLCVALDGKFCFLAGHVDSLIGVEGHVLDGDFVVGGLIELD